MQLLLEQLTRRQLGALAELHLDAIQLSGEAEGQAVAISREHGRHLVLAHVQAFAETPWDLLVDAPAGDGMPIAIQVNVRGPPALLRVLALELESEFDLADGQRVLRDQVVALEGEPVVVVPEAPIVVDEQGPPGHVAIFMNEICPIFIPG